MLNQLNLMLFLTLIGLSAQAIEIKGIVRKSDFSAGTLQVKIDQPDIIMFGDEVIHKRCVYDVTGKYGSYLMLKSEICPELEEIKKNQTLVFQVKNDGYKAKALDSYNDGFLSGKNSRSQFSPSKQTTITDGFRVSVLASNLDANVTGDVQNITVGANGELSGKLSLALGYASLQENGPGFLGNLTYTGFSDDVYLVRIDASIAYSFNSLVYVFSGINSGKFGGNELINKFNPALGFQAGVGLQLIDHVGLTLALIEHNSRASLGGIDYKSALSGVEAGINITF